MARRALEVLASADCTPGRRKLRPAAIKEHAPLLKVLGDETRLTILALLASSPGAVCVCDIEAHIGELSQSTISHHLKMLRDAGLVSSERHGTWMYYAIEREPLTALDDLRKVLGG